MPSASPTHNPTPAPTVPRRPFTGEGSLLGTPTDSPTVAPTVAFTPPEAVVIENSNAAVAYDSADCGGRSISLSSIYDNMLCGTHWNNSGGKGSCIDGDTCSNEKVRSIKLPGMTTAKCYKHCLAPTSADNVQYASIENLGTEAKCFDLSEVDISNIQLVGAVLKVDANVVGTPADCYESQCYTHVERCLGDQGCAPILQAAEELVVQGQGFLSAMRDEVTATAAANEAATNLLTCAGQHEDQCDPTKTASPEEEKQDDETVEGSTVPLRMPCRVMQPCQKPIQPLVSLPSRQSTSSVVTRIGSPVAAVAADDDTSKRRRLFAGTTTGLVQVSTSGNQGIIGSTTTTTVPASAQFASTSANASGPAAGGSAAVGTALATIGCVGLVGLLVAGVAYNRHAAKPESEEVIQQARSKTVSIQCEDDQVDVL